MAYEPTMLYAARIWGKACEKKYVKKLINERQRSVLCKCVKAYRTSSLINMLAITGITPLWMLIKQKYDVNQQKNKITFGKRIDYEKAVTMTSKLHPSEWRHIEYTYVKNEITANSMLNFENEMKELIIFTDGSKMKNGVGGAFVVAKKTQGFIHSKEMRLATHCNNFQAEMISIIEALKYIEEKKTESVRICTESLSSLIAITNYYNNNSLAVEARCLVSKLKNKQVKLNLTYVQAHIGIKGNELADRLAKQAAQSKDKKLIYDKRPKNYLT